MAMKDQIRRVSFPIPNSFHLELAEGALVSVSTYCFPDVTLFYLTPADARMIIDALTPLAQQSETTEAGETAQVSR